MIAENTTEYTSDIYLTARIDRIFKTIFVNSKDTRFMDAILSEVLDEPVKVLKFYPTELPVRNKNEKVKVLDVLLKTKDNKYLNVEVNTCFDEATRIRNFTYFTSYYSQKITRGNEYDTTSEFIQIDFNFDRKTLEKPKKVYEVLEKETLEQYVSRFKIITINLASIKEKWYDKNIKGKKNYIHLVMLSANKEELNELSKQDELVKEFDTKMFILNNDGTFTRTITEEEDRELLVNTRLTLAKKEALEQGQISEKLKIAKSMLAQKYDLKEIMNITGLTKSEINKLQKNK